MCRPDPVDTSATQVYPLPPTGKCRGHLPDLSGYCLGMTAEGEASISVIKVAPQFTAGGRVKVSYRLDRQVRISHAISGRNIALTASRNLNASLYVCV